MTVFDEFRCRRHMSFEGVDCSKASKIPRAARVPLCPADSNTIRRARVTTRWQLSSSFRSFAGSVGSKFLFLSLLEPPRKSSLRMPEVWSSTPSRQSCVTRRLFSKSLAFDVPEARRSVSIELSALPRRRASTEYVRRSRGVAATRLQKAPRGESTLRERPQTTGRLRVQARREAVVHVGLVVILALRALDVAVLDDGPVEDVLVPARVDRTSREAKTVVDKTRGVGRQASSS